MCKKTAFNKKDSFNKKENVKQILLTRKKDPTNEKLRKENPLNKKTT